jgi:hypothetical protein
MNLTRKSLRLTLLVVLSAGFMLPVSGQDEMPKLSKEKSMDVTDPSFDELQSPDINVPGASKKFRAKQWLEVSVDMKVKKWRPKLEDEYVDSLTIKWWVVVKGQDRKTYLIQKDVQHVNIPEDEAVVASVYLSPNTLKRITGKDRAGKSDLEAVGGEIHFGGEMVGFFTHGKSAGWWRKDLGSVEKTQKFPLLNKDETPFKIFWYDSYAEIAPKKN